ncbi:MAG: hypothetical protein H0W20_05605 [Chthoniobacterales bacterium]|nr:hypothetical protein [Chthoniobacterales bacterium]
MKIFTTRNPAVLTSIALALLVGVGLIGFAGCSTGRKVISHVTSPEGGKMYAVGVEKTPFYRHGPQQGNGPDEELPRDTVVKLIRHSFGYSKVVIAASGQQGFVASEDLTVASAALIAAATATPRPQIVAAPSRPKADNFDLQSADSSSVPPPEGLPAPDLPPPAIEPSPSE